MATPEERLQKLRNLRRLRELRAARGEAGGGQRERHDRGLPATEEDVEGLANLLRPLNIPASVAKVAVSTSPVASLLRTKGIIPPLPESGGQLAIDALTGESPPSSELFGTPELLDFPLDVLADQAGGIGLAGALRGAARAAAPTASKLATGIARLFPDNVKGTIPAPKGSKVVKSPEVFPTEPPGLLDKAHGAAVRAGKFLNDVTLQPNTRNPFPLVSESMGRVGRRLERGTYRPLDEAASRAQGSLPPSATIRKYGSTIPPVTARGLEKELTEINKLLSDLQTDIASKTSNFNVRASLEPIDAEFNKLIKQEIRAGNKTQASKVADDWMFTPAAKPDATMNMSELVQFERGLQRNAADAYGVPAQDAPMRARVFKGTAAKAREQGVETVRKANPQAANFYDELGRSQAGVLEALPVAQKRAATPARLLTEGDLRAGALGGIAGLGYMASQGSVDIPTLLLWLGGATAAKKTAQTIASPATRRLLGRSLDYASQTPFLDATVRQSIAGSSSPWTLLPSRRTDEEFE